MNRSLKFKLWCIYAMQLGYFVLVASYMFSSDPCIKAIGLVAYYHMAIPFLEDLHRKEWEEQNRKEVIQ